MISEASAELFKAHDFVLDNGLQVVVIENHKAPIIKHMLWYKSGAVNEEFGRGGSAHLLEHLMFRGTNKVPGDNFNLIMEKNGVVSNAFTSQDFTVYHQTADVSKLEVLMALEADRMRNLNFSKDAFAAEQKIVWQERKQVVENNPAAPFAERMNRIVWGSSAYAHPVTGLPDEIMALTAEDIYAFYHRYYAPNNAVLVLSGDIDANTAKELANKYYGAISQSKVKGNQPELINEHFTQVLQMELPNISTAKVTYKFVLPPRQKLGDDIYAYFLLAEYLGGDETAELYQKLVVQDKKAVSVGASVDFTAHSNGIFTITAMPVNDDAEELQILLIEAARKAVEQDLTAEKIAHLQHKVRAELVYLNDDPEDGAYWVGYMLASGYSLSEVQKYAEKLQNVSPEQIRAAFIKLQNASQVVGRLKPLAAIPEEETGDVE